MVVLVSDFEGSVLVVVAIEGGVARPYGGRGQAEEDEPRREPNLIKPRLEKQ